MKLLLFLFSQQVFAIMWKALPALKAFQRIFFRHTETRNIFNQCRVLAIICLMLYRPGKLYHKLCQHESLHSENARTIIRFDSL